MQEVNDWIDLSKTEKCKYSGQNNLDQVFRTTETTYTEMMIDLRKELVIEFDKLTTPYLEEVSLDATVLKKTPSQAEVTVKVGTADQDQAELDKIDVTFDNLEDNDEEENKDAKEINIEDSAVKDRWSRYIGAMGIEAVAKQAESTILISGLGGLGVEIAKNLVLAGCKELILHDSQMPKDFDLGNQFFLSEDDLDKDKTRAQLSKAKLQALNSYVKVSYINDETFKDSSFFEKNPRNVNVAVLTDCIGQSFSNQNIGDWNIIARKSGIQTIVADQNGVFSRVLTDFGTKHTVIDKNGEDIEPVIIRSIEAVTAIVKKESKADTTV
jgi:hypothetical protein